VWLGICTELGSLGLGEATIYFIGKDRKHLPMVFGNLLVAVGIISVALAGGGWLFLRYGRPNLLAQFPVWAWGVVTLLIPIYLLQMFLRQVLSAILCIKEINVVDVTRAIVQLALFVLLVVVLGKGIEGAFLAYAFSTIFAAGIFFVLVLCHGERPKKPDWTLLVASLRYGVIANLSSILWLLTLRLDTFLVPSLAVNGIQATGVYSVATNLAELLCFIPLSIYLSLFPMVSASLAPEANRLTPAACRHTLLLTIIFALGLGTAGPFAIHRLYGEAFVGAMNPLLLLLPGVVMLSQATVFFGDLNGRGKPEATLASTSLSLIVTVVLDFVLIPKFGITGAALASSCAYSIAFIIAGSSFVYYSKLSWRKLFVFRRSDLCYYLDVLPKVRKMIKLAH